MNIIDELEQMRKRMISNINTEFDLLIKRAKSEAPQTNTQKSADKPYDCTYPLIVGPAVFKGKKPIGLIFSDGRKYSITTWKQLVEAILKDCISDDSKKERLNELRGKISGKSRFLLSDTPDDMKSPIEICENLYFETHYDTSTLLRILTERILDAVSYNYSGIMVVIRND